MASILDQDFGSESEEGEFNPEPGVDSDDHNESDPEQTAPHTNGDRPQSNGKKGRHDDSKGSRAESSKENNGVKDDDEEDGDAVRNDPDDDDDDEDEEDEDDEDAISVFHHRQCLPDAELTYR